LGDDEVGEAEGSGPAVPLSERLQEAPLLGRPDRYDALGVGEDVGDAHGGKCTTGGKLHGELYRLRRAAAFAGIGDVDRRVGGVARALASTSARVVRVIYLAMLV